MPLVEGCHLEKKSSDGGEAAALALRATSSLRLLPAFWTTDAMRHAGISSLKASQLISSLSEAVRGDLLVARI